MAAALKKLRDKGFDVLMLHHAEAIMRFDMPSAMKEIETVLSGLTIPIEEIIGGGGGEAQSTQRMRRMFNEAGWTKETVRVRKFVDDHETESLSHEIDHVKRFKGGTIALEIEWNNKDPFFDRDLDSFKRLHADGAISVGIIITRGTLFQAKIGDRLRQFAKDRAVGSLNDLERFNYSPTPRQRSMLDRRLETGTPFVDAWLSLFLSDKFGKATTHWAKLDDRVRRGVGNPCPLVLIGIPDSVLEG
jgi:hypothetical protein